jgi:uncharacterized protein
MPVIDAHAHLEQRLLDLPAMLAQLDRHKIDRVALIPAMNDLIPHTPAALLSVVRALLRSPLHDLARRINDRLIDDDGNLVLRGQVIEIYGLPDNATVARAIAAHPDRFLGWIFLNPARMERPLEELERWRQQPGFVGVKLHPHWHGWPIEAALPIARRCEELRLPILIHLGFGDRGRWATLTDACPRLRILFAHAGIPHYQRMWPEVRASKNLYLDVSSPYLSERLVRAAVAAVGPERIVYGTDAPYGFDDGGSYDYGAIRGWVERLPVPAGKIDLILGDTTAALLAR